MYTQLVTGDGKLILHLHGDDTETIYWQKYQKNDKNMLKQN